MLRNVTGQVDVNTEVGVIHDYALRELRLFTDFGRTSRPLFIVEEGNQLAFKQKHLELLLNRYCKGVGFCGLSMSKKSILHCLSPRMFAPGIFSRYTTQ
jgi:hypothetical protein